MPNTSAYLAFATRLAHQAGAMMREGQASFRAELKPDHTIVTTIDRAINDMVITEVQRAYPHHGILAEEGSFMERDRDWLWVCDPIDGTAAYVAHVPTSAFSLALVHKGEPIVAVIYNPWTDDLFAATADSPTLRNGKPMHVSTRGPSDHPIIGAKGAGLTDDIFATPKGKHEIRSRSWGIIRFSGTAYKGGLIVEGGIDGAVYPHNGAHDIAAVQLIVTQAGGKVTDIAGNPQRYDRPINGAIISNSHIHDELVRLVTTVRKGRE